MEANSELISEKIKLFYLRRHPLFFNLSEEQLNYLGARIRMKKLRRNSIITFSNDADSRIFFIGEGTVKLVGSDHSGNAFLKDILVEGDIFGDITLTGLLHDEYVMVLKNHTFIFYMQAREFKTLLLSNHTMAFNFSATLANRLARISERHAVWNTGDARERLRYFFRGWAACDGQKLQNRIILQNNFSLSDIADFICVSRQFMHIMLKELKQEELLHYRKKEIEISESFLSEPSHRQQQAV